MPQTKTSAAKADGKAKAGKATGLPRIPAMIESGIIKPGDVLTILNHQNSEAVVVDASNARYGDKIMSYNEWGQKVTRWSALNVYKWAVLNGKTLSELRSKFG